MKYSIFKYAKTVFVADSLLALYWLATLIYVSVKDHEALLSCIVFGLHYAGLLALATIMDEATPDKSDPQGDDLYDPKHFPLSWGVALFLAAITDGFSLAEAHLAHSHGKIQEGTYYLLTVLFSLGLILTVVTFLVIVSHYAATKSARTKTGADKSEYYKRVTIAN